MAGKSINLFKRKAKQRKVSQPTATSGGRSMPSTRPSPKGRPSKGRRYPIRPGGGRGK